jgi:hypothetical protein
MTTPPQPKPARGLLGWELPAAERAKLRQIFPATYAVDPAIQHHITLALGAREDAPLPSATHGLVVGVADDGLGVQALVVSIDGTTVRPDGQTYHITWSLNRALGRKPSDSNRVLQRGWRKVRPVAIDLVPKFFKT